MDPSNHLYSDASSSANLPLLDEGDALAVIERETHFGSNFSVMRDYYQNTQSPGIHPEISLEQIDRLAAFETAHKKDLVALLSPSDIALIDEAKNAYAQLKQLYQIQSEQIIPAQRLADLILSEDEDPTEAIEALAALGEKALDPLLGLIEDERFYQSCFPGYGRAPELAAYCLKKLKHPRAISVLFHRIGKGDFFFEDVVLETLAAIGEPARQFLERKLTSTPITEENEKAAMSLVHFPPCEQLIERVIALLQDEAYRGNAVLLAHLVLIAIATEDSKKIAQLQQLRCDQSLPEIVRIDLSQLLANKKAEQ